MMPARLPERRESSAAAEIGEEMKKIRLDQLVFDLGYTESREPGKDHDNERPCFCERAAGR